MKLGSLFGTPKTLAKKPIVLPQKPIPGTRKKPGEFHIKWPALPVQQVKDYKAITTAGELKEYLQRCKETGLCGFDYETAASQAYRKLYKEKLEALQQQEPSKERDAELKALKEDYLKSPLDPWKSEICTVSLAAAPHEARVLFISHPGKRIFEPTLTREEAHKLAFDILDKELFQDQKVMKIAVNLAFETKHTTALGKYILMPVADPLVMWVRCLQVVAPQKIKDSKKPSMGKGLKPMTKEYFGVEMGEFTKLLEKYGVDFFDEISSDTQDALVYSAEDSDYALQHYLYWRDVAAQIPDYYDWLHNIEMPFSRVIGLMEYWGMAWDNDLAEIKKQEAENMMEVAANEIRRIAKDACNIEINPGKTGKTGDVKHVLFDLMKLPVAKVSQKTGDPSLDEESLIDMTFMLQHNLIDLNEEKYLAVELPENWEDLDPDTEKAMDKEVRQAIRIKKRAPHPYKEAGLKLLEQIQKMQTYSTLLSSHIIGRQKYLNEISGRIHASYSPWTETSRLNSFNPNGQNIPRMDNDVFEIRNFYKAPAGKILFFIDFSGFELRLMAWKSGDEVMIDAFKHGGDLHKKTASTMTGKPESEITKAERTHAKAGNFGISYGGTEYALQTTFKKDYGIRKTLDECAKVIAAVKGTYKRIPEYQRDIALKAREQGYVKTIYGYIRMLPNINSVDQSARRADERRAGNTGIQGSAADIMKKCQNKMYDAIGLGTAVKDHGLIAPLSHGKTDMIAQIHDECLFEMDDDPTVVEAACKWIKSVMEEPPLPDFPVPIEAEASVGYRWGEKMSVEKWLEDRRK